jgi:eukaryotic-like serine/threonine-protein kinase
MSKLEIDPASWSALNRLLDEALDRPSTDRAAWIEALGDEFSQLKPRLRELLAHSVEVETGDFLHTLPKFGVAGAADAARQLVAGQQVGGYRLVRELGTGGMGSVWLAERVDGLIQRPVALKLPHLVAAHSASLAERMAREREILATLDHRNIAKLLDAGITPDGQPFLALEYVEGVPIDSVCAGHDGSAPLDIPARLRLFRQVANAVAYAHGKLVVHRDLKPANILVTADGGVKLLDFGIAKLLDQGKAAETRLTEISGRALTPDYASPEQILGEPLTVASDVYSLGVILHELLTGTRPYRLTRNSRGALEEAILQSEPLQPSQAAPAAQRRLLRGDLDTIVLKALKKDPQQRYATVNALADDITRHLTRRPVLARPDSRWYRLRRFAARNSLAIGAAGLVLLAVIGGAGIAVWQARVAIAERDRAEAVRGFIVSVFEEADPYQQFGRPLTAAELLVRARDDMRAQFADDALLRLSLSNMIGASLLGLGDLGAAEEAARTTVDDAARTFGPVHRETLRARVLLAEVHAAQRDNAKLRPEVAELLPLARAAAGDEPDLLVRMLKASADLAIEEGRFPEGAAPAQEAFQLARTRLGETHPLTAAASTLYVEALLFAGAPVDQQLAEARRGLDLALAVSGGHPDSPRVIQMRDVYVRILSNAGDLRATVREADSLIEAARRTFGPDSLAAAYAMMNTARAYMAFGEVGIGLANSGKVLEILGAKISPDSHEFTYALANYAVLLVAARRFEEALPRVNAIVERSRELVGATHWNTVSMMFQQSHVLARLGRVEESRAVMAEAWAAGVSEQRRDWALRLDGVIQRLTGNPRESLEKLQESRRLSGTAATESERNRTALEIGLALLELGDATGAAAELGAVQATFEQLGIAMHPAYAELLVGLGRTHMMRNDAAAALPLFERAAAFWREFDAQNAAASDAQAWLGRARRLQRV